MASLLFLSSLLGLAASQTTTISYPNYGSGNGTIYGSVVAANAQVTTLALACPESEPDCGLFPYHTLVFGPSTWNLDMSKDGNGFTGTRDCTRVPQSGGEGDAVCTDWATGSDANFPGTSLRRYSASEIESMEVIVTKGVDKLESVPAKTTESGFSQATDEADVTQVTGSRSGSGSQSVSSTASTGAPSSTGAAIANSVALGGGFVGAAALLLGGILL